MSDMAFVTGLVSTNKLLVYDVQTNKKSSEFSYQSKEPISQVNKVVQQPKQKLLASGHEDRLIRFFDPNTSRAILIQANP